VIADSLAANSIKLIMKIADLRPTNGPISSKYEAQSVNIYGSEIADGSYKLVSI